MTRVLLTSVTRIGGFDHSPLTGATSRDALELAFWGRPNWQTGDYVVGRVRLGSALQVPVELPSGRMARLGEGDLVMGALGRRQATLEVVGSWEDVGEDLVFELLTPAGLLGRSTSRSDFVPPLVQLRYEGHVMRRGEPLRMRDFAPPPLPHELTLPVVLVVGSSMSAGKTMTACALIRTLVSMGRRVVGAKLTGAARYRDVLAMGDAGAEWLFDFVDAGLPSTVCDPQEYRAAIGSLLSRVGALPADVLVVEAGASPLEPYNGATAVEFLAPHVRCTALCASDPYAVVGIISAFKRRPDLVAGPTANTEAGIALVHKLTGLSALDARNPRCEGQLRELLERTLGEVHA